MFYVTVERLIRRRPEVVWEHLVDVSAIPAWVEGAVDATIVSDVKSGVGLEVAVVRQVGQKERMRRHTATVEVTAWRPNELLALETRVPGLLLLDRAVLEPAPGGTMLGFAAEIVFGDKLAEFFAFPQGMLGATQKLPLEAVYERSLEALAKRIEASSAIPYR